MEEKVLVKILLCTFLLFLFVSNASFLSALAEESCGCYNVCNKNFTTNSVHDVQKIKACQRGCRFYSLVLHKSHDLNKYKSVENAKEGCLQSCSESYLKESSVEVSSCRFGCSATELSGIMCNSVEIFTPVSYSIFIEESDFLIHSGEPEPDDALTDPGLRKQFKKKLIALLDAAPIIPEIHFRNLPVKPGKSSNLSHASFKCPKFYGFDTKFEFRNGKIIIGDLYIFVGFFIFVMLCFLLGNHVETKIMKRQSRESKFFEKDDFDNKEPLLKVDCSNTGVIEKENLPNCSPKKTEITFPIEGTPEEFETKFEGITLVFHEEDFIKDNKSVEDSLQI